MRTSGGARRDAGPDEAAGASDTQEIVRTRTVTLPDGSVVEVRRGWNDLPDGRRLWLYPDGTWSVSAPLARADGTRSGTGNAMDAVGPAGDLGSSGGPSPIVPGHELTIRHGAWSARRVDPLAAELVQTAVSSVSWLDDPTYRPAVTAWARAEARCQLLAEYLDEHGLLDPATGEPRPALVAAERMERLAVQQRQRLGLDPASRSQLEATLTTARQGQAALEEAIRRGQEAMERRAAGPGAPQDARNEPPGSDGPTAGETASPETRGAQDATGADR